MIVGEGGLSLFYLRSHVSHKSTTIGLCRPTETVEWHAAEEAQQIVKEKTTRERRSSDDGWKVKWGEKKDESQYWTRLRSRTWRWRWNERQWQKQGDEGTTDAFHQFMRMSTIMQIAQPSGASSAFFSISFIVLVEKCMCLECGDTSRWFLLSERHPFSRIDDDVIINGTRRRKKRNSMSESNIGGTDATVFRDSNDVVY